MLFALSHFQSLGAGMPLPAVLAQVVYTLGFGLFFAGLYLRTGSILVGILVHGVYDSAAILLEGVGPAEPTDLMAFLGLAIQVLPFVLGFVLLRKKHVPDMVELWTRVWPEPVSKPNDQANIGGSLL